VIPELGLFAIILALIASFVQASLPLIGAAKNQSPLMRAGCNAATANFFLILFAFGALMVAHVTDDFSVLNVVLNSHTQKPLLYKITGTWASHEGSMVLWVLILTGFGAAMARLIPEMPLAVRARALAVQGMTGAGFLAFIIFTSNPFARLWPALDQGNDLNPLLQDPGLAFHPPFLYIGYVGFSSVFSLAAALLLTKNSDMQSIKWLRPWALAAWSSLTFGIAMGSWWAYYELGWGGFWFWDPVENAALMPWLAGTALVHSLVASRVRGAFMRWTILLAILAFSLSLLGTFLVRSGALTSVHAFAVDPERGIFILGLLTLAVGGALTLYAFRAHTLPGTPLFAPVSRESFLLVNNLFLCTACATLLTGTLYPLLLDAVGGGTVSVGAPFFNITILPLMMPVAMLMVVGPFLQWHEGDLAPALANLKFAFALAVLGAATGFYLCGFKSVLGAFALLLGIWVIAGTLTDARRLAGTRMQHLPRLLAHAGFGVAIIGMAGAAFSQEKAFQMQPHQVEEFAGYRIELADIEQIQGPNFEAARGIFHITRGSDFGITMQPEQRYYPVQGAAISDVAIHTNFLWDLYLSLGEEQDDGNGVKTRTVRFHVNPLLPWIWIGGAIMALGGMTSLVNGRVVKRRDAP
jgi:cytochrome c-type biogenesis protein CcmF